MRSAAPESARTIMVAIFVSSVPFVMRGAQSDARLLPGLPSSALMFVSPALVAFWAAWRSGGSGGARRLAGRLFDFRRASPWTWHVASTLLFPGVLLLTYALLRTTRAPLPSPQVDWLAAPALFAVFLVGAAAEEVAWTATLLEPMQQRHGALGAGLAIGVLTAIWHLTTWQLFPVRSTAVVKEVRDAAVPRA